MGMLAGSFRTHSKLTLRAHCGQSGEYILKELTICPLGIGWVNCLKTLNKLTMCLPGKTPSAPSVWVDAILNRVAEGVGRDRVEIHAVIHI
jgi:hypothetical protein